jgi:hypothetical protein
VATQDGRYALTLGDGCDGAVPGVNVLMSSADAGSLMLQVIDPILGVQNQTCSVVDQECMSTEPCSTNRPASATWPGIDSDARRSRGTPRGLPPGPFPRWPIGDPSPNGTPRLRANW